MPAEHLAPDAQVAIRGEPEAEVQPPHLGTVRQVGQVERRAVPGGEDAPIELTEHIVELAEQIWLSPDEGAIARRHRQGDGSHPGHPRVGTSPPLDAVSISMSSPYTGR